MSSTGYFDFFENVFDTFTPAEEEPHRELSKLTKDDLEFHRYLTASFLYNWQILKEPIHISAQALMSIIDAWRAMHYIGETAVFSSKTVTFPSNIENLFEHTKEYGDFAVRRDFHETVMKHLIEEGLVIDVTNLYTESKILKIWPNYTYQIVHIPKKPETYLTQEQINEINFCHGTDNTFLYPLQVSSNCIMQMREYTQNPNWPVSRS